MNEKMGTDNLSTELSRKQYDQIAEKYQEATKRELREYAYVYSWKKLIGNSFSGKTVLDLACGEGVSSRLCRELGARKVVGIDQSKELIKKAAEEENKIEPEKRINYVVGDVSKLPIKEKFDFVTGAMMINYAPTKEILESMIMSAKESLREDGTFYLSIPNPERMMGAEGRGTAGYGVKMTPLSKGEGSEINIEISDFQENYICDFSNYYWKKETYEEIFKKCGFNMEWIPSEVSNEGKEKTKNLGENFWEEYEKTPIYIMIKAKLKK
jgi:SAM-dependent methyltransferase